MAEDTTEAASGTSGQPVAKKAKTEAEGRARAGGLNAKLAAETKANPPAPVEVRRLQGASIRCNKSVDGLQAALWTHGG